MHEPESDTTAGESDQEVRDVARPENEGHRLLKGALRPRRDEHDPRYGEHREERRQQAPRAASIEPLQREPALAGVLFEQKGRDEEAAEDEEEVDAKTGAAEPRVGTAEAVDGEHEQDRDGAQAIELGATAQLTHPTARYDRLGVARHWPNVQAGGGVRAACGG